MRRLTASIVSVFGGDARDARRHGLIFARCVRVVALARAGRCVMLAAECMLNELGGSCRLLIPWLFCAYKSLLKKEKHAPIITVPAGGVSAGRMSRGLDGPLKGVIRDVRRMNEYFASSARMRLPESFSTVE